MRCPNCGVEVNFALYSTNLGIHGRPAGRAVQFTWCPNEECAKLAVWYGATVGDDGFAIDPQWRLVEPIGAARGPVPKEVPANLATDYIEACNVLPYSAKASAALSRRCLQALLRAQGYKAKDLAKEVDLLLAESDASKAIPGHLRDVVDAVRNFGNFSAHPIDDITSLQVIDVEPDEAEWCLEIIEECFQHFYVRPAQAAARKAALNAKLAAAGKPPAK